MYACEKAGSEIISLWQ